MKIWRHPLKQTASKEHEPNLSGKAILIDIKNKTDYKKEDVTAIAKRVKRTTTKK
jgi:hypothetical protein